MGHRIKITNSPRTPAERRQQVKRYHHAEKRYNAEAGRVSQKMAGGAVVRVRPMAGGGAVPDINFQVLDDYLRGVLTAILQNMAAALPWPIRRLVEELLDAGRAPTVDEFQRVVRAVEKLV